MADAWGCNHSGPRASRLATLRGRSLAVHKRKPPSPPIMPALVAGTHALQQSTRASINLDIFSEFIIFNLNGLGSVPVGVLPLRKRRLFAF